MSEKAVLKPRLSAHERRASIIEAAIKLFSEKGFRGTTTRELAAAVGVSEPVLYEHFKTKSELYSAIIDSASREGLERVVELQERYLDIQDDRGFFTRLATIIINFHRKNPEYIRLLMFSSLENHELKQLMYSRQTQAFLELIAGYIQKRVDQGALRPIDPHFAARHFCSVVVHYSHMMVLCPEAMLPISEEEAVAGIVDLTLNGLCAHKSEPK